MVLSPSSRFIVALDQVGDGGQPMPVADVDQLRSPGDGQIGDIRGEHGPGDEQ
jgi:hypothetical protein